ncbi:MAG: signal peptidase I [Bacillota bacterium]
MNHDDNNLGEFGGTSLMEENDRPAPLEDTGKKPGPAGKILYAVEVILGIAMLALILSMVFVFRFFYVPTGSMEPTLKANDRIVVNMMGYKYREPRRGDIVVFKYPLNKNRDYVKRLIGMPGEEVEIKNSKVFINGKELKEDYLPPGVQCRNYGPVTVPENNYLMLGDNRANSEDSRMWGTLPRELVMGKAVMIFWPRDRITSLAADWL